MGDVISLDARVREGFRVRLRRRARACAPTRAEISLAVLSAALLVLSFPDLNLWPLAWVALVPVLVAVARRPHPSSSFLLGWITGTLFFYGSCYWLTHAMIRYGGIPAWAAYPLIIIPVVVVGLFPALCLMMLARAVGRWGTRAVFLVPLFWAALEWARLGITGQLWNAIGYSQAYQTALIQSARWGGVYLVGFLILVVNAAAAYLLLQRSVRALMPSALTILVAVTIILTSTLTAPHDASNLSASPAAIVVAVQPNVPMESEKSLAEIAALVERHYSLSETGMQKYAERWELPRVIIWPESPMTFRYADDTAFRELIARFAAKTNASILFNSQEPAPAGGTYNSAVMVNEKGGLVAQYDKIRLLPFGEYVPLPRWLPGVNMIPTMVGDFTPGAQYTLMPLGSSGARAGVFICFESTFPSISRQFAKDGADVLVNISNDGYLGETPVMRQHLANTVFRAVENSLPVVRVTNTGITAFITERGSVLDETEGFQPGVRTWIVNHSRIAATFYTKYGDLFAALCTVASLTLFVFTLKRKKRGRAAEAESA